MVEGEFKESFDASIPNLQIQDGIPYHTKQYAEARRVIPAHLVVQAISTTLHELCWPGPITPNEMQYVLTKYPQYYNGLVEEGDRSDFYMLRVPEPEKSSFLAGNFISLAEIQARNRVLKHCELTVTEDEHLLLFVPNYKDVMMLVGESYPVYLVG
uniref:Uncharacterized protein n=1 Tax=Nelumbo nucifera TaxID=4432 RepID=A0A822YD94_NELNU|nr:TPA_asm: hypothetical protein HUJ06_009401 [Nelumbo nucifera]